MHLRPGTFHTRISHTAQRACYMALRRKGWRVEVGILSVSAKRDDIDEKVTAREFRELLNKCAVIDAREAEKAKRERTPLVVDVP
jgi:hypothetical protein